MLKVVPFLGELRVQSRPAPVVNCLDLSSVRLPFSIHTEFGRDIFYSANLPHLFQSRLKGPRLVNVKDGLPFEDSVSVFDVEAILEGELIEHGFESGFVVPLGRLWQLENFVHD